MRTSDFGPAPKSETDTQEKNLPRSNGRLGRGSLAVIGIGPGSPEDLTARAVAALRSCEVIVGYRLYLQQVQCLTQGKEIIASSMRQEIKRCRHAIDLAVAGRSVAVISSGDAGIYGMAGPVLEILAERSLLGQLSVEIIPGVTAATAAASLLGAPLMHDFACISLSDLLTPWDKIAERLQNAAASDFVIVLYNPASRRRQGRLLEVRNLLLKYRSPDTPAGIIRQAYRQDQEIFITNLLEFTSCSIDMRSIVLVGNSQTKRLGSYLVTPRGYRL